MAVFRVNHALWMYTEKVKRVTVLDWLGILPQWHSRSIEVLITEALRQRFCPFETILTGLFCFFLMSRSTAAANKLEQAGFENIACMTSGLQSVKPGNQDFDPNASALSGLSSM